MSAQDHETERQAFKGEMRARRALSTNTGYRWFSWSYDFFTDFGWSFLRPVVLWVVIFVVTIFYYQLSASPQRPMGEQRSAICQSTNDFTHAANLAAQNAFVFGNYTQRVFINQAHQCLYGQVDGEKTIIRTPWHLSIVSKFHTLLSTILIFFTLLALRNRFKIK